MSGDIIDFAAWRRSKGAAQRNVGEHKLPEPKRTPSPEERLARLQACRRELFPEISEREQTPGDDEDVECDVLGRVLREDIDDLSPAQMLSRVFELSDYFWSLMPEDFPRPAYAQKRPEERV